MSDYNQICHRTHDEARTMKFHCHIYELESTVLAMDELEQFTVADLGAHIC